MSIANIKDSVRELEKKKTERYFIKGVVDEFSMFCIIMKNEHMAMKGHVLK